MRNCFSRAKDVHSLFERHHGPAKHYPEPERHYGTLAQL